MKKNFNFFRGLTTVAALACVLFMTSCSDEPVDNSVSSLKTENAKAFTLANAETDFVTLEGKAGAFENGTRTTTAPGDDRGRFNITFRYLTQLTDRQLSVFESAAARWERKSSRNPLYGPD